MRNNGGLNQFGNNQMSSGSVNKRDMAPVHMGN
jgi:hypothetical protein